MPNRTVHDDFGTATGALTAVARAGNRPNTHVFLEAFGGCLGGFAASRLPNKIDPPIYPNHRDVAHAVLPVGGALFALRETVGKLCKRFGRALTHSWLSARARIARRISSGYGINSSNGSAASSPDFLPARSEATHPTSRWIWPAFAGLPLICTGM